MRNRPKFNFITHRWIDLSIVFGMMIYIVYFSWLSIRSLRSLEAYGYDLAIFDQVIWNTAHGRWFATSIIPDSPSLLGHHYSPFLIALTPLYWIWDKVEIILIAQSIFLAIGALPLYWLAREKLGVKWGWIYPVAYWLFPPLEAGNLFDFHEVALAVPLVSFAFWFLLRKNNLGFAVCAFCALQVKEDISLLVVMFGLYAMFVQRRWKFGLIWSALGLFFFFFAILVVIPSAHPSQTDPIMARYSDLGNTPLQIVLTIITNPFKVIQVMGGKSALDYLIELSYPFGFLSLFAPVELLLCLPTLAINLLSNFTAMHRLAEQYPLMLVPFVAMSAVLGTARITLRIGKQSSLVKPTISILVLIGTLTGQRLHGLTPIGVASTDYSISLHAQQFQDIIAQIPSQASVWAQPNLIPFLTHRQNAFTFGEFGNADYLVLDIATAYNQDNIHQWIRDELMKNYHIITAKNGFLVLQRGIGNRNLPEEFFSFAHGQESEIQNKLYAKFGDDIELLGYNVRYYEWELTDEPQLFVYLRVLRPLSKIYRIQPYLIDQDGQVVGTANWLQATQVWYPASQWRVGEIVRLRINTTNWWTGAMPTFSIALGAMEGDDPWDVEARTKPSQIRSDAPIVLPSNATLLQIADFTCDSLMRRQFIRTVKLTQLPSDTFPVNVQFDNRIVLRGYQLGKSATQDAKNNYRITLFWQAIEPIEQKYTVFVHIIRPSGELVAQDDSPPNQGNTPTTVWRTDELISDRHIISVDSSNLQQGSVLIGLYDSQTGKRLPLSDGTDFYTLSIQ